MQSTIRAAVLALAAAMSASGLAAAEETKKPASPAPPTDDKAMLETWIKVATPGAGHRWLDPVIGSWVTKISTWMAPGTPPQQSTGTAEHRWVLGGRFVEQRYEGSFMGQPFSGVGYTGYDNFKKKYVGTWMDTMGTMIMVSQGDAAGKTLTMSSTIDDIITGKATAVKSEIKIVDTDHHTMEMWGPDPTGKPFKTMEIAYTRKK
jgi:hypothetical protein